MKARKRNSNDDWQEVEYVQLKDSYVITKADQMEFEQETTGGTKYLTNYAYDHWQDVRERAAIAAMQGLISGTQTVNALAKSAIEDNITVYEQAAIQSVKLADELVKELRKQEKPKE